MNDLRTAAQQALELLNRSREHFSVYTDGDWFQLERDCHSAITALRAALAQEQTEPWTPAALGPSLKLWFDPANPWASVQAEAEPAQQVMQDAVTTGVGIMRGGKRIDPASIYKQAEPVQEPVAWMHPHKPDQIRLSPQDGWLPLVIAPPRRTMVPLTKEEIERIHLHLSSTVGSSYKTVARAVEKASWEKNHG